MKSWEEIRAIGDEQDRVEEASRRLRASVIHMGHKICAMMELPKTEWPNPDCELCQDKEI